MFVGPSSAPTMFTCGMNAALTTSNLLVMQLFAVLLSSPLLALIHKKYLQVCLTQPSGQQAQQLDMRFTLTVSIIGAANPAIVAGTDIYRLPNGAQSRIQRVLTHLWASGMPQFRRSQRFGAAQSTRIRPPLNAYACPAIISLLKSNTNSVALNFLSQQLAERASRFAAATLRPRMRLCWSDPLSARWFSRKPMRHLGTHAPRSSAARCVSCAD